MGEKRAREEAGATFLTKKKNLIQITGMIYVCNPNQLLV